jgi:hypothetical protein
MIRIFYLQLVLTRIIFVAFPIIVLSQLVWELIVGLSTIIVESSNLDHNNCSGGPGMHNGACLNVPISNKFGLISSIDFSQNSFHRKMRTYSFGIGYSLLKK